MRRLLLVLAAVAPLAGCVSAEQLAKQDDAQCQRFGYAPGGINYFGCLQNQAALRQAEAERRSQERAQMRAFLAAAMAETGQMYQQRAAAAQAQAQAPATFQTCHTIVDPNTYAATTHCY